MTLPKFDGKGWPLHRYTVVESLSIGDLCEKVCIKMADGWRPQGGLCAVEVKNHDNDPPDDELVFYQAMMRDEVPPEELTGKSGFYGNE